jgi:hypothetical protein
MKWLGAVLFLVCPMAFAQANLSFAMQGYTTLRCQQTSRVSWVPQVNQLAAVYHFNGTAGTITNGATIASEIPGTNATATIASSTLAYANHPGAPSAIAFLQNYLTATGNANDIIGSSTLPSLTAGTWNFWVNMSIPSTTAMRLFYRSDNNSSAGYYFSINTSGTMDFRKVYSSSNSVVQTCPIATSFNNTWRMITVTWDGTASATNAKIYMNGFELVTTGSGSAYLASPGTCTNASTYGGYTFQQAGSGTSNDESAYPFYLTGVPASTSMVPTTTAFSGSMDEFAVWKTALSATEVFMLYRNQKCN